MPVITIRGQMGSGAPEIGKLVADELQIDFIDRELIAQVADELKLPKQEIAQKETPPSTRWGRIAEALGRSGPLTSSESAASYMPVYAIPVDDSRYLTGLETVIKKLAQSGEVVIRGRGSQFILKDFPESFHVLIVAQEDIRVKRMMADQELSEEEAKKEINYSDSTHRQFIKRYFKKELEDPVNYDIVINTSVLGYSDAAAIIINTLQLKLKAVKSKNKPV